MSSAADRWEYIDLTMADESTKRRQTPISEGQPVGKGSNLVRGFLNKFYYNYIRALCSPGVKLSEEDILYLVGWGKYKGNFPNLFVKEGVNGILYFSYRNHFAALPTNHTSDAGWGCLVRTGQMIVAQALMRHQAGHKNFVPHEKIENARRKVQELFMDTPTAPFGIHTIMQEAHKVGVPYGKALSPTQACKAIYQATLAYRDQGGDAPYPVKCLERVLVIPEIMNLLKSVGPLLLLIPVVFGLEKISNKYHKVLLGFLKMTSTCGIACGRRHASYYVCGCQRDQVIYLDPHYVQDAYKPEKANVKLIGKPNMIHVSGLHPCMLLPFYLPDEESFKTFIEDIGQLNEPLEFPIIQITNENAAENTTP